MLDITKLRELCEKVTPGPWKVVKSDLGDENICYVPTEIVGADGFPVISYEGGLAPDCPWKRSTIEANAEFIAKVRTAFPELLNEIEWYELNKNQLEDQGDKLIDENDQLEKALKLACVMIAKQTETCPEDLYDWCMSDGCPDNMAECWMRYFLEKVGEETCPNKHP